MLASLEYAKPLQDEREFSRLLDLLRSEGVQSYCEIGARYGGSFERIMRALPEGSLGLAVDMPGANFGDGASEPILRAAAGRLVASGYLVDVVIASSQSLRARATVANWAPWDALMIDADHAYEAVAADWDAYARHSRIVILHDIAAPPDLRSKTGCAVEVPRLWQELKPHYQHIEIVEPGSLMGIGVIWRDKWPK